MNRAKLLKLIPLSLGIALLSGCASIPIPYTATPSQTSERKEEKDKTQYIPKAISHTEIQMSELKTSNLKQEIEDTRNYVNFQQRYNPAVEGIVNALKQGRFEEVETRVKSLAARLEQDSSPYASEHLVRVKNFNYLVYEAEKVTEKVSSKNVHPLITPLATATSASMVGFSLTADAFGLIFVSLEKLGGEGESQYFEATRNTVGEVTTGSMSPLLEETNKTLEELRFRKIKVYPYTGKKVVLETDIPGSRLEQELKAITAKGNTESVNVSNPAKETPKKSSSWTKCGSAYLDRPTNRRPNKYYEIAESSDIKFGMWSHYIHLTLRLMHEDARGKRMPWGSNAQFKKFYWGVKENYRFHCAGKEYEIRHFPISNTRSRMEVYIHN